MSFDFDLNFIKCYKDDKGKRHVIAVASDNLLDLQGERFTEAGLNSMVSCIKNGVVRGLTDSHYSAFSFGTICDGTICKSDDFKDAIEMKVDIELKDQYPQSDDLFEDVSNGNDNYQLSVGGSLNIENPNSVIVTRDKESGKLIRELNDLKLDHIAVTAKNGAANPRMRFLHAIVKSLDPVDKKIFLSDVLTANGNVITKDNLEVEARKTIFKTQFDVYDQHIHLVMPNNLDENGNGKTESAKGIHPRSEDHVHDIAGFIVQDVEIEISDLGGDELEEDGFFFDNDSGSDNPGYRKGVMRSSHKSFGSMSGALLVGKSGDIGTSDSKHIDINRLTFEKRKNLPDEAFALPEMRRIPHHYCNVKSGDDHRSVNIRLLKEAIEYVNGDDFLRSSRITDDMRSIFREKVRDHLDAHYQALFVRAKVDNRKGKSFFARLFKSLINIVGKEKRNMNEFLKRISQLFAKMAEKGDDLELNEKELTEILEGRNALDEFLNSLGIGESELPESEEKADDKDGKQEKEEVSVDVSVDEKEETGELVGASKTSMIELAKVLGETIGKSLAPIVEELGQVKKGMEPLQLLVAKMAAGTDLDSIEELIDKDKDSDDDSIGFMDYLAPVIFDSLGDSAFSGGRDRQ